MKIVETRPLSKEKRWRVEEIINKAARIEVKPEEIATPEVLNEAKKTAVDVVGETGAAVTEVKPEDKKE